MDGGRKGEAIRIAHFLWGRCNPDSANGVDKTVYYLARAQAEAGHAVAIFSISDKPPIPVPGCEVKSYPVRRSPLPFNQGRLQEFLVLRSPLNLPPRLTRELLEWSPSIVHFHFVHLPQAIRLARRVRRLGIPYCVTPHGGLAVEAQRRNRLGKVVFSVLFERAYLDRAAFIHAISIADLEGTRAYGVHNRFVVAPNCIDPALMPRDVDATSVRRRIPAIASKRVFTFIGRIDPQQKGLDTLLKAWASVDAGNRGALLFVGPDWRDGRARLEAVASELGVTPSVFFLGSASGRDKWDLLASSDVFVHPSRWEAGVPFAVLEAMLAGKALLLTQPADPAQQVATAAAGVVVPQTERDIRNALTHLLNADASDLGRLGVAARSLIDDSFRWELTSETILDAYRVVVER